ncbi:MAG: YraN family protein [Alphaproteobacteria bacterium]
MQHQIQKRTNYSIGIEAENKAKEILQNMGFSIFTSRYQVGHGLEAGEIDIIAINKQKKLLLFIEVKKRKTLSLAGESIGTTQMKRIYSSAEFFLSNHKEFENFDCRFDAILFDDFFNHEYIENAWGL